MALCNVAIAFLLFRSYNKSKSSSKMVAIAGLNTANNLSLYALPAAWLIAIAPHMYAQALYNKERAPGTPAWDNSFPKKNIRQIKDAKLSPVMEETYLRAEAANENNFINLPFFAAALVAGNVARLTPATLNIAAGVYLGSRVAYTLLYINGNGTNDLKGNLRSAAYLTGVITCLTLFVQAGNRLYGF